MKLFFRKYSEGHPLVVLHGLYGSSDNWVSVARQLSEYFEVYLLDLRNHGQSPHSPEHNYPAMVEDLREFFDDHSISKACVMGHSMGGKTAMYFALLYPQLISNLIIVDIAPKTYSFEGDDVSQLMDHKRIISSLQSVDFEIVKSLEDADKQLQNFVKVDRLRQFLLKNVKHLGGGRYGFKLNLKSLAQNLNNLLAGFEDFDELTGKTGNLYRTLFIRGADSDYILESDFPLLKSLFPYSEIVSIKGAGHWLHAEKPEQFIEIVEHFIF